MEWLRGMEWDGMGRVIVMASFRASIAECVCVCVLHVLVLVPGSMEYTWNMRYRRLAQGKH